jgi:hypothetical protein
MPEEVIEISAQLAIDSIDDKTGDVAIIYMLSVKNISDISLEKIILKEFYPPKDLIMDQYYFEIFVLHPGEKKTVTFPVTIKGWGLAPKKQTWEVEFTIRIEQQGGYAEQGGFIYHINLAP